MSESRRNDRSAEASDETPETTPQPSSRTSRRRRPRRRRRSSAKGKRPQEVEARESSTAAQPADGAVVPSAPQGANGNANGLAESDLVRLRLPINGPDGVVVYTRRLREQAKRYLLRELFD